MAQSKATHIGECQCCCRRQMLPKGRLAKHGYQVAGYGFFNGVCWAAGELPYEVSCDFIKDTILPRLRNELKSLSEFKVRLLEPAIEPKGYHQVYGRFGGYWSKVDVVLENDTLYLVYDENNKHRRNHSFRYTWLSGHDKTVLGLCTLMNKYYAEGEVSRNIKFIEREIRSQERRVAEWKLADLEPVNKVA